MNSNNIPDNCECLVASYCSSSPNSAGPGVQISFHGISSVSLNNVILNAQGGPNHQPGLFFYGPGATSQPFGDGIRCVTTPSFRLPPPVFFTGAADPSGPGNAGSQIDLTTGAPSSGPGQIQAGSTWYFQLWYRDPQGGPWGFNLSNGLEITFCP